MGLREFFGFGLRPDYLAGPITGVLSPWSDSGHLSPGIVWADAMNVDPANLPLTKETALQVPAVSRAHNLVVGIVQQLPLKVLDASGELAVQPSWTFRTDSLETPGGRMARVFSDCFFYGSSALAVKNDSRGNVLQLAHIPFERWSIRSPDGAILVDGSTVDSSEIIIVNPVFDGMLQTAAPAIRLGRNLERAKDERAQNPVPMMLFSHNNTDTSTGGLEPEERRQLLDGYKAAQRENGNAAAYMPPGIKAEAFGTGETDFFQSAINANTTAIGQHANIRASMLDGTLQDSSSETYKNAQGERSAFWSYDLPFWLRPIEEALSNDRLYGGAVARGQYVRFDTSSFLNAPTPTGEPADD